MSLARGWLRPEWDVAGVGATMTTRAGNTSEGHPASMNLRLGGDDDDDKVRANRAILAEAIGATPIYLRQIHGARVVSLTAKDAAAGAAVHEADASVTAEPGVACVVLVADCLPVLIAAPDGRAVGAAHAGWRGLAAGVVEATVAKVAELARCAPGELSAWLAACIGPEAFEVGPDVVAAFGADREARAVRRFVPTREGKWLADLPGLARDRLTAAGVRRIFGGAECTVRDASRFFSFRRDRTNDRMAAAIWIERGALGG